MTSATAALILDTANHRMRNFLNPLLLACMLLHGCTSPMPEPIAGFSPSRGRSSENGARVVGNDWNAIAAESGPVMQIMICIGNAYGTHTGLRVIDENNRILFWDPAGRYGIGTAAIQRTRDVICHDHAPTLAEYVAWRIDGAGDDTVAVYEWNLTPVRAEQFQAILSGDASHTPGGEAFETTTLGLYCCKAVCEFLDRFADPDITVPRYWFRPEHLARHLWTQRPTRVLVYRADKPTQIYLQDQTPRPR